VCAIAIVVGIVYLRQRRYEEDSGVIGADNRPIKVAKKNNRYMAWGVVCMNNMYVLFSVLAFGVEAPLYFRFDGSTSAVHNLEPTDGKADTEY